MNVKIKKILTGIASCFSQRYTFSSVGTGGSDSARYCYSVWLRHLTIAYHYGLSCQPTVVAELGPGDSLGIGLAALLSGSNRYYALDVIDYANNERNIEVLDSLLQLFKDRESIPDDTEFPELQPYLTTYTFPNQILPRDRLNEALKETRVSAIRKALENLGTSCDGIQISYFVPWHDPMSIKEKSVDMIYSQAVLEHIDDLDHTYHALYSWLKPSAFMSHQIDFTAHELALEWNGHWAYSDFLWRLIRGKSPYILNRQPFSTHLHLLERLNFRVLSVSKTKAMSGISRSKLATRFRHLSDDDLATSAAFVFAVKR